jgi:twitching motility protein PilJ
VKLQSIQRYIDNLSTAGKFRLVTRFGTGIVVTAFVAVAAIYFFVWSSQREQRAQVEQVAQFDAYVSAAQLHIREALESQLTFRRSRTEKPVQAFNAAIQQTRDDLKGALVIAPNLDARAMVEELQRETTALNDVFAKLTSAVTEAGVNETSGLHGKMRTSVREIEDRVEAVRADALTISMLQMRRNEKDFIQRERSEYLDRNTAERERFRKLLSDSTFASRNRSEIETKLDAYYEAFRAFATQTLKANELDREFQAQIDSKLAPVIQRAKELASGLVTVQRTELASAEQRSLIMFAALFVVTVLVALIANTTVTRQMSNSIVGSVERLAETVEQVSKGNYDARTKLTSSDEIGVVGRAFDTLIADRVATLAKSQRENDVLNNSIIRVLQAVAELSKRDLSVKVPVNEDITGPVADAINALSSETAKVLQGVTNISTEVARASNDVKLKSDAVMLTAEKERHQVDETAKRMAVAANEMNKIAELARQSQTAADAAIKTTQDALKTVTATVAGISSTRDTIRETEKRIKRLGERSQEISGVVSLINSIAERTHILALNASMHAASAGEAGRGFAVVADEVQRLAENAREATTQISTLVSSIQSETQDTVNTMNSAISQVVEGSKLAEEAGRQMQATQDTTSELVKSVQQISTNSLRQAKLTNELQEYAKQIRESTAQTSQQLTEQGEQTKNLVGYANKLVESVSVFKLPARAA